jgi:hypothetical protein
MGPQSHTRLAKLLRRLRQATPEQLEAIERILAGPAVPERLRPGQPRYALHREGPLWRLRFEASSALPAGAKQPIRGPRRPEGERRAERLPPLRPARRDSLGGESVTGFPHATTFVAPYRVKEAAEQEMGTVRIPGRCDDHFRPDCRLPDCRLGWYYWATGERGDT